MSMRLTIECRHGVAGPHGLNVTRSVPGPAGPTLCFESETYLTLDSILDALVRSGALRVEYLIDGQPGIEPIDGDWVERRYVSDWWEGAA